MEDNWKYYTTVSGDTWDSIAHMLFKDSKEMDFLVFWNEEYSEYFSFPAGVVLKYKNLIITDVSIPPWRR